MTDESQVSKEIKLDKELRLADDFSPPSYEEWKALAEASLNGASFEKKLVTGTYEGINLHPIYTATDVEGLGHMDQKPGFAGNVRGNYAAGYLAHPWEVCQEISIPDAHQFNDALKYDLQRGQTSVFLSLDVATRSGLDSDSADDAGPRVGNGKVAISTLEDFSAALENVDLEKFPLHVDAGISALEPLMLLNGLLKKQGQEVSRINGSIGADPLGFLATYGALPHETENVFNRMSMAVNWANVHMPTMKTIGVSGLPYHNAGADAVSELAYVLASAVQYIDEMIERDLSIDTIASSIRFTFGIGPFFFMEIAKLRAARMLWSKIIDLYGGSPEAAKMIIHGRTSFYNQSQYDPYVNMLRTTTEAFSAIVAGVDSLSTNPFNETLGGTDEFSRRVTRNTQIVLNEECRADQVIDPAGGSYFVEKLTAEVAEKAWQMFQGIEAAGGMLQAVQKGIPQQHVAGVAKKRKDDIAKRKAIIVGTNFSADLKEEKPLTCFPDYDVFYSQRKQYLNTYRQARGKGQQTVITDKINGLKTIFTDGASDKTVTAGTELFLAGATMGEVSSATVTSGKILTVPPLELHRQAEIFERLRDAVEVYKEKTGSAVGPKLFLATMGTMAQYKARADFSLSFFEIGGFHVIAPQGPGFETAEAAVIATQESGAGVVVICSTDELYPQWVAPIVSGLKEKNPGVIVVLAGYPKDQVETYKAAGVDEFIFLGADAVQILSGILKKLGVL